MKSTMLFPPKLAYVYANKKKNINQECQLEIGKYKFLKAFNFIIAY